MAKIYEVSCQDYGTAEVYAQSPNEAALKFLGSYPVEFGNYRQIFNVLVDGTPMGVHLRIEVQVELALEALALEAPPNGRY